MGLLLPILPLVVYCLHQPLPSPAPSLPPRRGGNFVSLAYNRSHVPMPAPPDPSSRANLPLELSLVWKLARTEVIALITTLGSAKCSTGEAQGAVSFSQATSC